MQRPSVLLINRVYPPVRGATGRVLRDLAQAMAADGWDVQVLTTGVRKEIVRDGGVQVRYVKAPQNPKGALGYWRVWKALYKGAAQLKPVHLVVSMTDPPLLVRLGAKIAKKMGARHMHWCQDLYPDILPALGFSFPRPLMSYFETRSAQAMCSADKVVAIGRCMAKRLTKKGVVPGQISFIPNWPDKELMDVTQSPHDQTYHRQVAHARAHEDQIKDDPKFCVLYAGNLGLAHPLETILKAALVMRDQAADIEFLFVGEGPKFERVARYRDRHHLDNIRLLPYQPLERLRMMMEAGDVHLISMQDDAAGLLVPSKIYAAIATQRPSIFLGPMNSEGAKVLKDYAAGSVVSQGNVQGLVDAIVAYRTDADHWFAAHHGAREARSVFVPEQSLNAWVERAWAVVEPDLKKVKYG